MLILALDTTSRAGSLALARGREILETLPVEAPEGFGQILYQAIRNLLSRHGLALADIDCYAAAAGPGSFTGIRVGLTAVKALAEVHGKTVIPVSNLRALASAGSGRYRAPVMDARRGEVYAAVYDEQLRVVVPEVVMPWEEFLDVVGNREVTFVATDLRLFGPSGAAPLDPKVRPGCGRLAVSPGLAAAVARIAADRCLAGTALPPDQVEANYVRRPDAELKWKDP